MPKMLMLPELIFLIKHFWPQSISLFASPLCARRNCNKRRWEYSCKEVFMLAA